MAHHFGLLVVLLLAPVFLALLPWPVAIVACLAIAASAGLTLAYASRALEAPVTTGREAMLGGTVEVLGRVMAGWQVRYYSEIWSAISADTLCPGRQARIVDVQGLKLVVTRAEPGAPPAQQALIEARRDTARSLAGLERRMAELAAQAQDREEAARRVLPDDEEAARQYLAQRRALLAMQGRLAEQAAALRADLAGWDELAQALGTPLPSRDGGEPCQQEE